MIMVVPFLVHAYFQLCFVLLTVDVYLMCALFQLLYSLVPVDFAFLLQNICLKDTEKINMLKKQYREECPKVKFCIENRTKTSNYLIFEQKYAKY